MSTTPADAWPRGDLAEWGDDQARIHHDFFNETTRPYTAEENAAADARAVAALTERNEQTLRSQATQGLTDNRAFLALASPTNVQTLAQVRVLTRQMNALIRLAVHDLTATD